MLRMSPPIGSHLQVGKDGRSERDELVRKAAIMEADTFSVKSFPDWSDAEADEAKSFLDDHELRVGEVAPFYGGRDLGSPNPQAHQASLLHLRRQMQIGRRVGAHCIGFGWGKEFDGPTPAIWSEETWRERLAGVAELAKAAEDESIDVAGHPLFFSPLGSVARYKEMLKAVSSPRLKVLIDIVNLTMPHMVFNTTDFVNEVFDELGDHITALHAKDVKIAGAGLGRVPKVEKGLSLIHVDEVPPGEGVLDYAAILKRLDELDHDVTIHVEHFNYEDTIAGQQYIRSIARQVGVELV